MEVFLFTALAVKVSHLDFKSSQHLEGTFLSI
jgi:hypothetical protein